MAAKAPRNLRKGDTVLLIATARKVSREEMRPAVMLLESWGLKVEEGRSLYSASGQFAGSDQERTEDLQWALDHPTAAAIIVARGGYGTMRIIDHVNFSAYRKNPKWFVGYSDLTIMHGELFRQGFQSLHATMPINFHRNERATVTLRQLLFGEGISYGLPAHTLNRAGEATGPLVGGNLSLLYALKGTGSQLDLRGKILFIEDLDEYLYHVDRMVLSLKRAGQFEGLAGVVIGGLTEMKDNAVAFGKTAEEIVAEHLADYSFPVCFNFPAGHVDENLAFRHGAQTRLLVNSSGSMVEYV